MFKGGASVVVYSNSPCSSTFCLSSTFGIRWVIACFPLVCLAHLSRRLTGELIYSIGRSLPYVCVSTFSKIFSSEATGPIEAKFHMVPLWDGGTKICSIGPCLLSHDQDDRHTHLLRNQKADGIETWYEHQVFK